MAVNTNRLLCLQTQLELPPDAVVLIAVLHPADDMGTSASRPQAELPSWQAASASSASGQNGASAAGGERAPASQPASISKPGLAVSPASDGSGAADAEVAAANGVYYPSPVPQDKDDEPGQVQREAATDDDLLVGTFEVAFTEAARTKELTLNPPSVRRSFFMPYPRWSMRCKRQAHKFTIFLKLHLHAVAYAAPRLS